MANKNTLVAIDGMYIIYHSIFRTIRLWESKNKAEYKEYMDRPEGAGQSNLLESKTFKSGLDMSIIHTAQRITDIISKAAPEFFGLEPKTYADQLFFIDDKTSRGFRKKIYPNYKVQRKAGRAKMVFDLGAIRQYILGYLLDEIDIWNRLGYTKVFVEGVEADDVIYTAMTEYRDAYDHKILIASDHDFLQIPDITQYNLQGKLIKAVDRYGESISSRDFLLRKILMGDGSDNIPSIIPRCGAAKAESLTNNPAELKKILNENSEARDQFALNKKLIDMTKIPEDLTNTIKKHLSDIMTANNTSNSHDLDLLLGVNPLNSPL